MTVAIDERFTAKNLTRAAAVPATWLIGPRTITSITIHWWGNPVGQTYAGIIDWFCNPQSSVETSAHYVASAGQAACIVSPWDAAWHAGSAYGNVHSIGIECNPRCSDGDYATIADVVAQLRKMYGNLPLFAHNHWTSTTCPGDYRLDRIDALAANITNQSTNVVVIPPTTPQKDWFDMATQEDVKAAFREVLAENLSATAAAGQAGTYAWAIMNGRNHSAATDVSATANGHALAVLPGMKAVLDQINAKPPVVVPPSASSTVTLDAVGAQAIADQIKTQLGPDIVQAIAAQWAK